MTTSIKNIARIGGVLYLVIIIAGLFGEMFVRNKLIVSGDAMATANNIMASQMLWRAGIAGDLIMHVCDIPLTLIFYILLKPVSKHLSLLAAFFNLTQTTILGINKLHLLIPLFLLGGANYLKAFEPHQLAALAYLPLKVHGYGFGIGLIFFGFRCLVAGYLMTKSDYFPKVLGVLQIIAGLSYLINSFALLLAPAFADMLFPAILVPAFIGEFLLCLWMMVKGVKQPETAAY